MGSPSAQRTTAKRRDSVAEPNEQPLLGRRAAVNTCRRAEHAVLGWFEVCFSFAGLGCCRFAFRSSGFGFGTVVAHSLSEVTHTSAPSIRVRVRVLGKSFLSLAEH